MNSSIIRLLLVIAAFAIVPECWAADTAGGNVFLDAKYGALVGKGTGNSGESTTAWGADGGYLWKLDDARSLGFELGYAQFGKISDNGGNFGRDQVSASAISLGAHFQVLFGEDRATVFQLRGGLTSVKFEDDFTSNFPTPSAGTDSQSKTGIYLGLGIGRQLTQGFSVLLAYNFYGATGSGGEGTDLSVNWLGLVAEYRFGE